MPVSQMDGLFLSGISVPPAINIPCLETQRQKAAFLLLFLYTIFDRCGKVNAHVPRCTRTCTHASPLVYIQALSSTPEKSLRRWEYKLFFFPRRTRCSGCSEDSFLTLSLNGQMGGGQQRRLTIKSGWLVFLLCQSSHSELGEKEPESHSHKSMQYNGLGAEGATTRKSGCKEITIEQPSHQLITSLFSLFSLCFPNQILKNPGLCLQCLLKNPQ